LTEIQITANDVASERYAALLETDLDWVERAEIVDMVREVTQHEKVKTASIVIRDTKSPAFFRVLVTSRRLGEDTGPDMLLDVGGQVESPVIGTSPPG